LTPDAAMSGAVSEPSLIFVPSIALKAMSRVSTLRLMI
jgi:hypothetical protein